jgi:hypothetical protein
MNKDRGKVLQIRLSEKELSDIKKISQSYDMDVSDYIRRLIFNYFPFNNK